MLFSRYLLLLCFTGFALQTAYGQSYEQYRNFRDRLNSQFLVPGTAQGFSVPAAYRNPLTGIIKWSDATVDLGWYLAVLATENELIRYQPGYAVEGYGLEQNEQHLYDALKALERLDVYAETAFLLCPGLPSRNGFFIRDDTPAGFHTQFPGMSGVLSDYISLNIYDKEMSQDQVYHLLMGLATVSAFVDPSSEFGGTNLRELAVDLAQLIVRHVAVQSNWTIRNPVCDKVVDRGPDAWSLAHGTNEMLKFINGGSPNYNNDVVVSVNQALWPSLADVLNPIHINSDNTHMIMTIGSVGKLWNNSTLQKLMNLSNLQDFYLYPLLHAALYGSAQTTGWDAYAIPLQNTVLNMLNDAPADGPASPQPIAGTNGWGSNNRFIRKRSSHINGSDGSIGQQYNGLDFMLLFNLYQMLYGCDEVAFEPVENGTTCLVKTDIDLSPFGRPVGGNFSGPGVLSGQFFNPSVAGIGEHWLYYTIDGDCSGTDSTLIAVDVCTGIQSLFPDRPTVFPNPASETVILDWSQIEERSLGWKLYTSDGRVVREGPVELFSAGAHRLEISLEERPAGLYFLRMSDEEGRVHTQSLMVR